jgi:hypothetical protein
MGKWDGRFFLGIALEEGKEEVMDIFNRDVDMSDWIKAAGFLLGWTICVWFFPIN